MLYHLLFPLADTVGGLNVVRYITFRTAAATLTALFISFLVGPWLIRRLTALRIGQPIREIGFIRFEPADVVRHPLVQSIIQAYDRAGKRPARSTGKSKNLKAKTPKPRDDPFENSRGSEGVLRRRSWSKIGRACSNGLWMRFVRT